MGGCSSTFIPRSFLSISWDTQLARPASMLLIASLNGASRFRTLQACFKTQGTALTLDRIWLSTVAKIRIALAMISLCHGGTTLAFSGSFPTKRILGTMGTPILGTQPWALTIGYHSAVPALTCHGRVRRVIPRVAITQVGRLSAARLRRRVQGKAT